MQILKQLIMLKAMIQPVIDKFLEEASPVVEPQDEFLSIKQACNFLFMHERKLRRLKDAGAISCINIGRSRIYSKKELQRFLRDNS